MRNFTTTLVCRMRQSMVGIFVSLLLVIPSIAHNNVVVVPLFETGIANQIRNVITVAINSGDFSDLKVAMASITDASAINPYLIQIAPGVYDMSTVGVVVKSHVSIVGSGQGITVISGSNSNVASSPPEMLAPISILSNSRISNLTASNNGDGSRILGLSYASKYLETMSLLLR